MTPDETTAKATRFCKDCVHFGTETNSRACSVAVGMFVEPDPVTGEMDVMEAKNWSARKQREQGDRCGIEARWFAPKPPSMMERIIARMKS